jgi:2-polyprenyl-6-methoxyphenol hydroxylase-like FAD-dependent oxidoreductase
MGAGTDWDVPVLIVGGGPIGLALAAELGRRGVRATLIEARDELADDRQGDAKMLWVSVRTMEWCRQLGVGEAVRHCGFPLDEGLDSVFVTSLNGHELGRVRTPTLAEEEDSSGSPERDRPCPQIWFDPILRRFAGGTGKVDMRFGTRLVSFVQDEDGVTATVRGAAGPYELRAAYLVGCDGFASTVRPLMGVEIRGERRLDLSMNVYLRIRDLVRTHDKGSAFRYVMVGTDGVWAVLTTIDGRDFYRLQLIGVESDGLDEEQLKAVVHRCIGAEVACVIERVSTWSAR